MLGITEAVHVPNFLASVSEFSFIAFCSIFFLVDPFAAVPPFLAMTHSATEEGRRRMAARASWTCFIVLAIFAISGSFIFKIFGITMAAFEIAGGLILLLIGLEMLQARRSTQDDYGDNDGKEDIGITPLGIPLLAGPGAISTVMVLVGTSENWQHKLAIFVAIVCTALASYFILSSADKVRRRMGDTGIRIMMRIMGLMLTAIAVQFVINGLARLHVLDLPVQ